MTNTEMLQRAIEVSGLQKKFIAEKLGLSRQSFSVKLHGKAEFRLQEVSDLCRILSLSTSERDAIFFS